MPNGYEVPISPEAFENLCQSVDKAAEKVDMLDNKIRGLGSNASSVTIGGRQVDMSSFRPGGNGYGPGPNDKTYQFIRGPESQRQLAYRGLETAENSGDEMLIRDAKGRIARLDKSVERQNRLMDGDEKRNPLIDMIMTSRIGPGGQLYPLVNKLQRAGLTTAEDLGGMGFSPGMASKLAPFVASLAAAAFPVAIGASAVGAPIVGANMASEVIGKATQFYYGPGGTSKEIGQAMALGVSPDKAMSFGDELRQGSYGAAYMHGHGLSDFGPYTDDKTGNYVKGLEALRGASGDVQRRRIIRDMPSLGDKAWVTDLPNEDWNRLKDSMGDMGTPEQRRNRAQFEASKQELGNAWDKFVGGPIGQGAMNIARDTIGATGANGLKGFEDYAWRLMDPFGIHGAWNKESYSEATSTEGLSGQQPTIRDGSGLPYTNLHNDPYMQGGGPRAAAAAPSPGYSYQFMDDKFTGQQMNLGAFSVS